MENIVLTIHLILAVTLIGTVLLQRSEGGGLGMGSSGGGGGVMSGRSAASALAKVTWALAIAFLITSLSLTVIAAKKQAGDSVIERLGTEAADTAQPAAADEDLLPPVEPEAPLTPPPAE